MREEEFKAHPVAANEEAVNPILTISQENSLAIQSLANEVVVIKNNTLENPKVKLMIIYTTSICLTFVFLRVFKFQHVSDLLYLNSPFN